MKASTRLIPLLWAGARKHLDKRGIDGHDDCNRNFKQATMVGQRKRMISCGSRNDALFLLLRRELHESITRASFFERAGVLFELLLDKDLRSSDVTQTRAQFAGGPSHIASDVIGGLRHVFENHRQRAARLDELFCSFRLQPILDSCMCMRRQENMYVAAA